MSFRFNFTCPTDFEISGNKSFTSASDEPNSKQQKEKEVIIDRCGSISFPNIKSENKNGDVSLLQVGDLEIKYVLVKHIQVKTEDETFSQIDALQTDIIPGKYEGGLKIWECSIDLAMYLTENECIKNGNAVLELGCGAGIPGIVAYLKGATVTFQDFNAEVLEYVTLPNTLVNTSEDKLSSVPNVCQYLYGDWGSIQKKYYADSATATKYDVILTSETIYEKSSQKKLLDLMKAALKPQGTIYLAAKIFYFGVGGSITDFEDLVKEDQTFEMCSVQRITVGVERQILKMNFIRR